MANYAALKATIDANIRANGNEEITGPVLNGVLTNILAVMGQAGYLFKGMAHPGDTPAASDSNLFYLAVEAGQYSGFDGRTVTAGQLVIFAWDGAWASDVLLDISGKANKNGDPAEAFTVFTLTAQSNIVGAAVTGETVGADKVILHNPDNNAMTDIVPGGQSEDIEVALPSKAGTLALQEDVDAAMAQKANVDGYYGGMTVGAAENLVGRGSVDAEYQGIRTSADTDDIGVGAAMITKMQGASIVWNQLADGLGTVTVPTGHRVYQRIGGVASIITSAGTPIAFGSGDMVTDLTLVFGATIAAAMTVEQFERMFPLPYYAHNAGRIRNNEATGIKTVGYNLYNHATGKAVLPGKYSSYPLEYEICGTFSTISFEDYAGNVSTPALVDGRFFNVDRPGVLTVTGGNATDTLVHLVWSGWRNSDQPDYVYEPYWENTLHLNLKTITGKLNGEGASVVIYPDGLRGTGSAFDYLIVDADGYARTAVKVVGGVDDMGERSWSVDSRGRMNGGAINGKYISNTIAPNILCARYIADTPGNTYNHVNDKVVSLDSNVRIIVYDSAYTDPAVFKAAMAGVELIYQLATPEVYTLDNPIYMGYPVDDFGTEAKLPVDDATLPTGPIRYEVRYPFNAIDTLRNLPVNYISKESMQAYLTARGPIDNGTWTMTWNAVAGRYDFTFTPNGE